MYKTTDATGVKEADNKFQQIFGIWKIDRGIPVQLLSLVRLFVTPWTAACQASLSITNSQSLLRFMSIESVMPFNHFILCHPLLLSSIFPSIRVFSNELVHIRGPKFWSFSFSISPSNEYSGLISFTIDWFDLPAVQYLIKKDAATNWNVATPEMPSNRINKGELIYQPITLKKGFPGGSDSKESTCNVGDLGSIPGLRRSPGGGYGNPLQHSYLENPMDRGAWWDCSSWGHKESDMTEAGTQSLRSLGLGSISVRWS